MGNELNEKKNKLVAKGYKFELVEKNDLFGDMRFYNVISPTGRPILNGVDGAFLKRWLERVNIVD